MLKKAFALQDMSYLFTEELEAKSTEEKILALTAFETKQKRYEQQVLVPYVQEAEKQQLQKRLAKHFSPDEKISSWNAKFRLPAQKGNSVG